MRKLSNRQKRKIRQREHRANRPDIVVRGATVSYWSGQSWEWLGETTAPIELTIADDASEQKADGINQERERLQGLIGQTFTFRVQLSEAATEPLGIIDQLTWGPRLN